MEDKHKGIKYGIAYADKRINDDGETEYLISSEQQWLSDYALYMRAAKQTGIVH